MFYSLTILTLLASILFYSFYPRNDGIKNVDMPAAKAYVTEFVAHHMAAVEAARAISYDSEAGKNKMAYESWIPNSQIDIANYVNYMPPNTPENVLNDRIANPTLYCFDNANGSQSNCAQRTANTADSNFGSSDYIITFLDAGEAIDARALGEKMFLTSYSPDEHLKTQCGILVEGSADDYDPRGTCVVDNTRYLTVSLPREFSCSGISGLEGQLVCITQISAAYDGTTKVSPQ
ncbi:MAG: hypothetical protein ACI4RJ_03365 [Alphaproteobacteria bacterium]